MIFWGERNYKQILNFIWVKMKNFQKVKKRYVFSQIANILESFTWENIA